MSVRKTTIKQLLNYLFSEWSLDRPVPDYAAALSTLKIKSSRHKYCSDVVVNTIESVVYTHTFIDRVWSGLCTNMMYYCSSGWPQTATVFFSSISDSTTSGHQWWQERISMLIGFRVTVSQKFFSRHSHRPAQIHVYSPLRIDFVCHRTMRKVCFALGVNTP